MSIPAIKNLKHLLSGIRYILDSERERQRLKGETFNIFSILRMENKENATHSAFLCELLNPQGSHFQGSLFLELFLQMLRRDIAPELSFDGKQATSVVEYYIGPRNDEAETGGRIDIYLSDKNGNTISIENKIYAGDQVAQVARYCNHRVGKNTVLYLTLYGNEPSLGSSLDKVCGTDYHCISYKEDIIEWLKHCQKEATELPILRESIRQYIILLKKLTGTMDDKANVELKQLMLEHYEEAAYVATNFEAAKNDIREEIRQAVFEYIKYKLDPEFSIQMGEPTTVAQSQIWLRPKNTSKPEFFYGIESFSGRGWKNGDLFVGVFDDNSSESTPLFPDRECLSEYWADISLIPDYEEYACNLSDGKLLKKLLDKTFRDKFVQHLGDHIISYVEDTKYQVFKRLKELPSVS